MMVFAPRIGLARSGHVTSIRLATWQNINEPALHVTVSIGCGVSVQRDFQILLDPVASTPASTAPQQVIPAVPDESRAASPVPPANTNTATGRSPAPRKKRQASQPDTPHQVNAEAAPTPTPEARPKTRAKTVKVPRSLLRLSPVDTSDNVAAPPLRLERSDTLSMAADMQKPAEQNPRAAAGAQGSSDASQATEALLTALRAEVEALRAETRQIQQQSQAERAALEAMRNASFNWNVGLGALLVLCLAAIGCLLWRITTMQTRAAQASWNDYFARHGAATISDTIHAARAEEETLRTSAGNLAVPTTASDGPTTEPGTAPICREKSTDTAANTKTRTDTHAGQPFKYEYHGTPPYLFVNRTEHALTEADQFLKAEEISDVMELVEAWTVLNDPEKVLELLKPFSEIEQPESPLPWICLLDVYRSLGLQERYEAILERITTLFNVKLTPWDARADRLPPKTLAAFPHVAEKIVSLWESDEIMPYLESLLRDNRDGTREGFDLPVYRDILRLISLAKDPARPKAQDRQMDQRAYAILFAPPPPPAPVVASDQPKEDPTIARSSSPPAGPKVRPRERPKYMTPSYERTLTGRDAAQSPASSEDKEAGPADSSEQQAPDSANAANSDAASSTTAQPAQGRTPLETNHVPGTQTASPAAESAALQTEETSPSADIEASGTDHDELSPMAIKLHLAIAYQDIGDKEGAQLLLEEVVQEGSTEQSEQARSMLAKFA
ncbi:MAG: FimV/HubP family polar landmark protein [Noviherbaspirillum sp.]